MLKARSLAISTLLGLKKKYQMRRESQCKKNVLQVEVRVDIDHCAPWSLEVAFSPQRKICKKSQCVWRWLSHSGSGDKLQNVSCFLGPVQFSSVAQSCPTLCDPMNRSMPGLPVHHQLPEFTQIHVHRVSDAIQPPHPLSSPSPPALNPSQHQNLFQWVNSSHEVAKVLEFQL